jgi:hypothetical protein
MRADGAEHELIAVGRAEPVMPPAPATFSTMTVWPKTSPMRAATMRPRISVGPPAANGMTMVSEREGKSSARAGSAQANVAAANAATIRNFMSMVLGLVFLDRFLV